MTMALNPFQREVQAQLAGLGVKLEEIVKIAEGLHHAIESKLPVVDEAVLDVIVEGNQLQKSMANLAALVQEIGSAE